MRKWVINIMELNALEKSILQTITYFAIYHFPLTALEVFRNLWQTPVGATIVSVEVGLTDLIEKEIIASRDGFFFLKKQAEDPVRLRRERYLVAKEKMEKGLKYIKLMARLPFARAVFVVNNLGYLNAPDDADIDLAIISAKNRIWTARFVCAGLMKLFNKRPTAKTQKNRICLSFFVDENQLDLRSLAYESDIHFTYWIRQFMPVCGDEALINRFFTANGWTSQSLPNLWPINVNERWRVTGASTFKRSSETILSGRAGDWLEKFLKKWQLKIMPRRLLELAVSNPKDVVLGDAVLKFHDKDTRLAIRDRWQKEVAGIF